VSPSEDSLAERVLRLEAEREILATLHQYGHALDDGRLEDFLDCFAEDGVWESAPPRRFEGRAGLAALFEDLAWMRLPPARFRHLVVEPRVVLKGDRATCASYFVSLRADPAGPQVFAFGRYEDEFFPSGDGRWRLRRRRAESENRIAGGGGSR
jgi:ketosteroid isomerase-like protein